MPEDASADRNRAVMISDRTVSGSLAATDDVVTVVMESHQAAIVELSGTWAGTVTPQVSADGGTTWRAADFFDITNKTIVANATANGTFVILRAGGLTHARVTFTRTSGTVTVALRATFALFIYSEAGGPNNTALPPQGILIGGSDGTNLQLIRVAADNADALAVLTTANLLRIASEGFGFNGTSWDRLRSGDASNLAAATGLLNALAAGRYDAVRVALTSGRFSALQLGSQGALDVGLRNPDATGALFPASAAGADGLTNPTISQVGADLMLYNGTTWDRKRANQDSVLSLTDAGTASYTGADLTNYNKKGLYLTISVTTLTGTSITPTLQGKDPVGGGYFQLHANFAAITATGQYVYLIYPGAGAAAGGITAVASAPVPRTFRLTVAKTSVTAFQATYGVSLVE